MGPFLFQIMAPSVKRRLTPVSYAKQLLSAISYIKEQKQISNFERISKYLQRYSDITPRRCKEHLNNAVSDGFIVEYTALGFKGQRTGLEQEGYRIPKKGEEDDVLVSLCIWDIYTVCCKRKLTLCFGTFLFVVWTALKQTVLIELHCLTLMQDNAPTQSACVTMAYLQDHKGNCMPWSAVFPYLRPIENACAIMHRELRQRPQALNSS